MENSIVEDDQSSEPGSMIAKARKSSERSLDDFASELCISKDHLKAIENNQFDDMGGPTYVKGYIRAYARALGIDEKVQVAAYSRLGHKEHVLTANAPIETHRSNGLAQLVGVAIVAMVGIGLLTVWLLGGKSDESSLMPDSTPEIIVPEENNTVSKREAGTLIDSTKETVKETAANQWVEEVPPLATATPAATPESVQVTVNSIQSIESPKLKDNSELTDSKATKNTKKTTVATDLAGLQKSVEVKKSNASSDSIAAKNKGEKAQQKETPDLQKTASTPVFIGAGGDLVNITLSEDSWVEVQDSAGAMLLQGLYSAGAIKNIRGVAPFQVFLGNAPGVSVTLNNQYFNTTASTRSNKTARFALVNP